MEQTRTQNNTDINSDITNNGVQAITGPILNAILINLSDSALYKTERFLPYLFPYELETYNNSGCPGHDATFVGKYYIYNWSGTGCNIDPSVSAGDIVTYVLSTDQYEKATYPDADILVYVKDDGKTYLKNKLTGVWSDAGAIVYSHNKLNDLQGGSSTERYHLSAADVNKLSSLYEYKVKFLDVRVYSVGTSTPSSPVNGYWYIINHVPKQYDSSTGLYTEHSEWAGGLHPDFNYLVLEESTGKTWVYNQGTDQFEDGNVNIHVDHNRQYNLQGGSTSEKYHQTLAANSVSERAVTREKVFGEFTVLTYSNALPSVATVGDRQLTSSGVQKYDGSNWVTEIDTTLAGGNKEYYFISESNSHTYVSNSDNSDFIDAGKAKIFDHNELYNLQGGNTTEKYHLTLSEKNKLTSLVAPTYSQVIFVSSTGDDANDGSSTNPVKTETGIINNMVSKYVVISIAENYTGLTISNTFLEACATTGVVKVTFSGTMTNHSGTISFTRSSKSNNLYEFDAAAVSPLDSDLSSGTFFIGSGGTPTRGTDVVPESSFTNESLLISDAGATLSDEVYEITSKVTITATNYAKDIEFSFDSLIVASSYNYVLGTYAYLYQSVLLPSNDVYSDLKFYNGAIKASASAASINLYGDVEFNDLLISGVFSSSALSTGSVNVYGKLEGDDLFMTGYGTLIKTYPTTVINVKNSFSASAFDTLLDVNNGGYVNLSTNIQSEKKGIIGKYVASNLYFVETTSAVYDLHRSIYANMLGYVTASGTTLNYMDTSSTISTMYAQRDTSNIKVLLSKYELERDTIVERVTGVTTYDIDVLNTSLSHSAFINVYILEVGGNSRQVSINIANSATTMVELDGGANAGAGDSTFTLSYSSGTLTVGGLTSSNGYVIECDIKRFF